MPIYEYICEDCNEAFERLVPAARANVSCPRCSSRNVTKRFSTFAPRGGSSQASLPCGEGGYPACAAGESCPGGRCPLS